MLKSDTDRTLRSPQTPTAIVPIYSREAKDTRFGPCCFISLMTKSIAHPTSQHNSLWMHQRAKARPRRCGF